MFLEIKNKFRPEDYFAGFFEDLYPEHQAYDDVGDAYEYRIEIPGFKKSEVSITPDRGSIRVEATRKLNDRELKKKGSFSLPLNGDVSQADAVLEDGILTIRVPKLKPASPRMIPIK